MSIIKRGRWLAAGIMTAALAAFAPALVSGQAAQYTAQLIGADEVPPTTSAATGTFTATLDETAQTLTLEPGGTIDHGCSRGAHPRRRRRRERGDCLHIIHAIEPGGVDERIRCRDAGDLSGSLAGNWAGFVAARNSGGLYVNVHTTANPGGEIRGQVTDVSQGKSTATATATGTATSTPTATSTTTATPTRTATSVATSTATPSAPTTGQAGLVDDSDNSGGGDPARSARRCRGCGRPSADEPPSLESTLALMPIWGDVRVSMIADRCLTGVNSWHTRSSRRASAARPARSGAPQAPSRASATIYTSSTRSSASTAEHAALSARLRRSSTTSAISVAPSRVHRRPLRRLSSRTASARAASCASTSARSTPSRCRIRHTTTTFTAWPRSTRASAQAAVCANRPAAGRRLHRPATRDAQAARLPGRDP